MDTDREKIETLRIRVEEVRRRADSRGEPPPDLSKRSKPIEPIARFSEDGKLIWNDTITIRIRSLGGLDKRKGVST